MFGLLRNVRKISAGVGAIVATAVVGIGAAAADTSTAVSVHSQFGMAVHVDYTGGGVSLKDVQVDSRETKLLPKTFPANTKVTWKAKPKQPSELVECSGEATVSGAKFTIELTPGTCLPNFNLKTEISVHSMIGVPVTVDYTGGGLNLKGIPAELHETRFLTSGVFANTTIKWVAKPKQPTTFTECLGEAKVYGVKFTIEVTPGTCVPNYNPPGQGPTAVTVRSEFRVAVSVDYSGGIDQKNVSAEPKGPAHLLKAVPSNTKIKWTAKLKQPAEFIECSGEETVSGPVATIVLKTGNCVPNLNWKKS
jgi:hypothetical protein